MDKKKRQTIDDIRSGRNGYDAPWAIQDTECADAVNVDFYKSRLGNKRGGMLSPTTTGTTRTGVTSSLFRHVPSTDETLAELWAVDDAATPIVERLAGGTAWSAPALKDAPTGNGWDFTAASINGKLVLAYKSAQGRLHIYDPATGTVRRTGLPAPVAPTVADQGTGHTIGFDAAASLNYASGTTFSHTCSASATILWVFTKAASAVSAVTYNGVAMTQSGHLTSTYDAQMWFLVSPASGAHTVAITSAGSVGAASASYTNARITSVPDVAATGHNQGTATATETLTPVSDLCWTVMGTSDLGAAAPTAGTGSTLRAVASAASALGIFDSGGPVTPPAPKSMSVGITAASDGLSIMNAFGVNSGSYSAVLRYYRIRWTVQSAGVTIRRSEPGAYVAFTPGGSGDSARVTQPAVANEGETHWEVEASTDSFTFYRIATVAIGTTTYDDSAATTSYASSAANTLSALTGTYTLQKSYKYVAADQNRLLGYGSWTPTDKQARIEISAVIGSLNVGDEERVDTSLVNSYIDLDENDSGVATGLAGPIFGAYFAFKDRQVWQLTPTGTTAQPYRQESISKSIGAISQLAICRGEDKNGNAALYWMSHRGPYRWSINGLEYIGRNIEDYVSPGGVATINLGATKSVARAVYYADKRQVWMWWATGSSNDCNQGFIFDVQTGGWSRVPSGDLWANIRCVTLFANTLGAAMSRDLKPYVGQTGGTLRIWKADTGTDDNGTAFQAYVITKAIEPGGPGFSGGVGDSTLLAKAAAGVTITDTITADFGIQTVTGTADLTPTSMSETRVTRRIEGSALSGDVKFIQHQIGDAAAISNAWTLDRIVPTTAKHEASAA